MSYRLTAIIMKSLVFILCIFVSSAIYGATKTWIGDVSSDWNDPNNWSGNTLPVDDDDIIIDADDYTNAPIISSNSAFEPDDVTIRDGGVLTKTGGSLTVRDDILMDDGTFDHQGGALDVDEIEISNASVADLTGGTITMSGDLDANSNSIFNIATTVTQTDTSEDLNIGTGATFNILPGANVSGFDDVDFDGSGNGTYNQTGGFLSIDDDFKLQDGDNNVVNVSGGQLDVGDDFEVETDDNTITFSGDADVDVGDNFEFTNGADGNDFQITDNATLDVTDDVRFTDASNTSFVVDGFSVVNAGGTDDISEFEVSEGGTANVGGTTLPVDLIDFIGYSEKETIVLEWATASEKDNDRFELFKSTDGVNFSLLTTVAGAGNSKQMQSYSFTDRVPLSGMNYYRLVQHDYDGKFEVLKLISVQFSDFVESKLKIYPNPTTDSFQISHPGFSDSQEVTVMDLKGNVVYQGVTSTNGKIELPSIQQGLYIVQTVVQSRPVQSYLLVK